MNLKTVYWYRSVLLFIVTHFAARITLDFKIHRSPETKQERMQGIIHPFDILIEVNEAYFEDLKDFL